MASCLPQGEKQHKTHGRFYALLSLLLCCCFADYVFALSIPQVVFLGIALAIVVTGDSDEIAALCICCIPLHTYLEYAFIILFALICHVFKHGGTIRLHRFILPVVAMILWELLHSFVPTLNLMQFGGHTMTWLMLAVFMCTTGHTFDYSFIVRAFVLSTTVICCSLVARLLYTAGMNFAAMLLSLQRLGVEDGTTKINPNTLGILCIIGVSGLLQLRRAGRGRKQDLFFMLTLLLFGVMTASKTFFVCLMFMALLFLFSTPGSMQKKLRYLGSLVLIAVVVLIISYIVMPDLLRYYFSRFFEKDFTTGRLDTMGEYHKYLMDNWDVLFLGIGLQDFSGRVLNLCPQAVFVPHNGLQELVLAWGLPGIALFAALWGAMILQSRRVNARQGLINYIPLLVMLMKTLAGQMLNSAYTMMVFTFAYLSMCTDLTGEGAPQPGSALPDRAAPAEEGEISLLQAISCLWQKKFILAAITMTAAVMAFGVTKIFVTPVYDASVLIYVNNSSLAVSSMADAISSGDITASRTLVSTYRIILKSRQTLQEVIDAAGTETSCEELEQIIRADAENGTEILRVTVSHPDPRQAQQLANAVAGVLPARISGIIDGTSASVIDYAVVPLTPSSPSKAKNTIVGFMTGFVLGAMILLLHAMRRAKIDEKALTALYPYPVLAAIPHLEADDHSTRRR